LKRYAWDNHNDVAASSILLTTFQEEWGAHGKWVIDKDNFIQWPVIRQSVHEVNIVPIFCKLTGIKIVVVLDSENLSDPFGESLWSPILISFHRCFLSCINRFVESIQ
jgi:hypothetical protein